MTSGNDNPPRNENRSENTKQAPRSARSKTHERHLVYGTWALAVGTWVVALLAYCTFQDNRATSVEERRAWVGPLVGKLAQPLEFNKEAEIVISLQNTGREPAKNVSYYPEITTPSIDDDRTGAMQRDIDAFVAKCFSNESKTSPDAKVLYPTLPFSAADELRAKFHGSYIDWNVIYGLKILLVKNCIAYETARQVHHSSFCHYYWNGVSPDNEVYACGKGGARAD